MSYCKNCGNNMDPNASVCVKCGVQKNVGNSFCPNCGNGTDEKATFCVKCGVSLNSTNNNQNNGFNSFVQGGQQNNSQANVQGPPKQKSTAAVLAFLLGGLGIHNFYLGFTNKAILQIVLTFCLGIGYIWAIVDGVQILTGTIDKDANGVPLV